MPRSQSAMPPRQQTYFTQTNFIKNNCAGKKLFPKNALFLSSLAIWRDDPHLNLNKFWLQICSYGIQEPRLNADSKFKYFFALELEFQIGSFEYYNFEFEGFSA